MDATNLLIIMDDEHNKKFLGCYGHPQVKTPHLDGLARDGVLFNRAYTNSPICVPARASLATGRYVHEVKCWDNAIAYDGSIPSWTHRLQEAGHPVTSIGKLHYRLEDDPTGFDEQIVPMHIADGKGDLMGSVRPDVPVRYQSRRYAEQVGPGTTPYIEYDRDIAARAADWLKASKGKASDKPWVLFVSFICPHFPLVVPQEYFNLYPVDEIALPKPADTAYQQSHPWWKGFRKSYVIDEGFTDDEHRRVAIAAYQGLCTFTDDNVGTVLKALDDSGQAGETRVAFFSDHGDNMGARQLWGKSNMYEESAGIPLLMRGPGLPRGLVVETPVSLVDMHPTILESAGVPPHADDRDLPGRSLVEIANADDDPERTVFSEYHAAASESGCYMIRKGRYKYVNYTHFPPELFDLDADPEELRNLSTDPAHAETLKDFEALLRGLVDVEGVDAEAKADQARLIESQGGREAVLNRGGLHGTPAPGMKTELFPG